MPRVPGEACAGTRTAGRPELQQNVAREHCSANKAHRPGAASCGVKGAGVRAAGIDRAISCETAKGKARSLHLDGAEPEGKTRTLKPQGRAPAETEKAISAPFD